MSGPGDQAQRPSLFDLMGHTVAIHQLDQQLHRVAQTHWTIIIEGEPGTGKELVARFLHAYSARAAKPFVALDCGAIAESGGESELFGSVREAGTGAAQRTVGYFELASGGTVLLDEITHLTQEVQRQLTTSVQEHCILPLGSTCRIPVDVRLMVASTVPLELAVRAGRFRPDLFHCLNECTLTLVPLRERPEDILFLAERFRVETNAILGKAIEGFTAEAQAVLLARPWPGNVRELRNTVRRAVLLSETVIAPPALR